MITLVLAALVIVVGVGVITTAIRGIVQLSKEFKDEDRKAEARIEALNKGLLLVARAFEEAAQYQLSKVERSKIEAIASSSSLSQSERDFCLNFLLTQPPTSPATSKTSSERRGV